MIQPRDYHIQIDYDEAGVMVVVLHKPSGLELRERPSSTESVGALKERLIAQIEHKFYPSEDFEMGHYQIGRDGVRGGSWGVRHLPTGIVRGANTFDNPDLRKTGHNKIFQQLMREVVAEIWRRKNASEL